jgi:peptide deformylase
MYFQANFRLLTYGPEMNNILAKPVEESEWTELPRLFKYMVDVMRKTNRKGLAAPQIGCFKQFMVIERRDSSIIGLVNPEITRMYGEEICGEETCLSLPPFENKCRVARLNVVDVEASLAVDPEVRVGFTFRDEVAIIVQHKLDHLSGTSFIDRATKGQRSKVMNSFNNWKAMRRAQIRMTEESKNVDAGLVAACCGQSRLS